MIRKLLATQPVWTARKRWENPEHPMQKLMAAAGLTFGKADDIPMESLGGMSRREAIFILTLMCAARDFSVKSYSLQRAGMDNNGIRFAICGQGHEGIQAAMSPELEEFTGSVGISVRDEGAYYYRGQTFHMAHGGSILDLMRLAYSLPSDETGGTQMPVMWGNMKLGIIPMAADVGSHVPSTVARAKANLLLNQPGVVIASIGDGATRAAPVTSSIPEALARVLPRRLRVAIDRAANPDKDSPDFESAKKELMLVLQEEIPPQFVDQLPAAIRAITEAQTSDEFIKNALPMVHRTFPTQTPWILLVEDNGYGLSVSTDQVLPNGVRPESGPEGMLYLQVDGSDVIQARRAWRKAFVHTRARRGPVMMWAKVERMGPHSTSDGPERYVPKAQSERQTAKDPLPFYIQQLKEAGIIDDSTIIDSCIT